MVVAENYLKNMFGFEDQLKNEIQTLRIETFKRGKVVIKQNSYINSLPLLLHGNLRVYRQTEDREILFYYVEQGGTCGMTLAACLERKIMNSEVMVMETSDVLWVPQPKVLEWLHKYSSWNDFIIRTFTQRQMQLVETVDDIAFHKIDKRIKDYLFDLYEEKKDPIIPITHQALANELGTTRVVISRILKSLELEGVIALLRGAIILKKFPTGASMS